MKSISQELIRRTEAFLISLLIVMASAVAHAGALRVSPAKLEFEVDAKSGVVSLLNEGSRRFRLFVTASEWSQNAEGRDLYTETSDIVFYPTTIMLEAGGQQVIRVGTRGSPSAREKTYRLMIEEISEPDGQILRKDSNISKGVGIRSAILMFVKPRVERFSGEIEKLALSNGVVSVAIRNTGNAHVIVTSVSMRGTASDGKELFSRELAGWYLLSGATGNFRTDIPGDICRGLVRLDSEVTLNKYSLKKGIEVRKEMCAL